MKKIISAVIVLFMFFTVCTPVMANQTQPATTATNTTTSSTATTASTIKFTDVDENTEERAVSDKESCSFGDNEYILKAAFSKEEEVSTLVLREDLRFSQRIESFEIYAKLNGEYKKIGNGTVIGSKKILFLKEKVKTSELLIAVTGTRENPVIRDIAFYN